nr:unnamed protein product [Callosobruchus chinensis]
MSSTETAEEVDCSVELSPPRKRFKKRHLSVEVKKHELEYSAGVTINEIVQKVADKVGTCRASIFNVLKEYKNSHSFSEPRTNQNRTNQNRTSLIELIDDADRHAIRRKVHEFFFRNEIPSIDKVLRVVNEDPHLPTFRRSSFYKLLKALNFKLQKRGRNSALIDRNEIILWRREYLTKIKNYRSQNRKIYFLDETWINAGHTKAKVSMDQFGISAKREFLEALSIGLKGPTITFSKSKGKRLIIRHIGCEDGFVDGGLWCMESKKATDYHEEMNGEGFENWFSNILPRLEDNCVIVLENAPCHSRKLEKLPTSASKKSDIQDWLSSKNIAFDKSMLKLQLLEIVKQHKAEYDKYRIDVMAKLQNKTVLRLPPYHCELNAIELIWADIKNFVAQHNTTFKFSDMELLSTAVKRITPETWKKCVQHVQEKVEVQMWELDNIIERRIQPIMIQFDDNESTTSSE